MAYNFQKQAFIASTLYFPQFWYLSDVLVKQFAAVTITSPVSGSPYDNLCKNVRNLWMGLCLLPSFTLSSALLHII